MMLKYLMVIAALLFAPLVQAQSVEAIDKVWAGHSVGFAVTTSASHIYVAYYDANRQLSVAQRPLNNPAHWVYHKVDTWLGWDSHNLIAIALDKDGAVHVAGNMHVDPLTYFRSDPSGDVRTLKRVPVMVDAAKETAMTYPVFLKDDAGQLIFKYRDGTSGRGNEIYNIYDETMGSWKALTSAPLVDGEGKRNAYFVGPVQGPDGLFHIAWVWRDSPHAETNHDLSYAKSRDLINWQAADGRPLALPIRLSEADIVDPVPVKGGMINNNTVVGFDDQGRVLITYHKHDQAGNTQIWVARREGNRWNRRQISDWQGYRWDFKGTGSLNSELFVEGARPLDQGRLVVRVVRLGQAIEFVINADNLKLIEERTVASVADRLKARIAVPDGQQINTVETKGPKGEVYVLAWTARPPNRDRPSDNIPPASDLMLFHNP
ncbi:BNR repeat-containing protein [Asticcacaulis sp. SL142]|uniref:BNR repeat-containing protein n=1 Tax=Asticcacaulis sp. SL142 TaxID=2995155 RepID=UPI00226CCEE4|nr:BNR repeat-containing protein [Asticcacaulis sp. SL142]WAC47137.1 BNR repeat-containing protein [Asticcacaulis sp. SL142]